MVPFLRSVAILGVFLLTLLSALPPWEICWHPDGSLCLTPESVPCCDEEEPAPSEPEPCSDCADLATFEAWKNDSRPQTFHQSSVSSALPTVAATSSALVESWKPSFPALGPPLGPPSSLLNRPIRC